MNPEYSIWLLPEEQQEQQLCATIAMLPRRLGGEAFMPHVTLQGDLARPCAELAEAVGELAKDIPCLRWPVQAVACGDHFFRCLYLRFAADTHFAALQDRTRALTGTADGLSPFPHLSLAYGEANAETMAERDALSSAFQNREIVLNRVALVRSSKDVPIAEWRILAQHTLSGR